MCGLAGFVRLEKDIPPTTLGIKTFLHLTVLSQLRGFDSSGVAAMYKQKRKSGKNSKRIKMRRGWLAHKAIDSPYDVWCALRRELAERWYKDKKENGDDYDAPYFYAAIAHARQATKGTISSDNAHPFVFGANRFIGTHNGTISNAQTVFNKLNNNKNLQPLPGTTAPTKAYGHKKNKDDLTDSEIVLYCIYRWGIEKVYPLIEGAWAFVWWEQHTNTINFIRNSQRTLYYFPSYNSDCLFWSSEREMIEFSLDRVASTKSASEFDNNRCRIFQTHKWYSFDINNPPKAQVVDTKDINWKAIKDLSDLLPSTNIYSNPYAGWTTGDENYTPPEYKKRSRIKMNRSNTNGTHNVTHLEYDAKKGGLVPVKDVITMPSVPISGLPSDQEELRQALDEMGESCCIWCTDNISPDNSTDSLRIKQSGIVCGNCAMDFEKVDEIIEYYPHAGEQIEWVKRWDDLYTLKYVYLLGPKDTQGKK